MFVKNAAVWDRVLRTLVGLVVLSLVVWGPKSLWGLVGLVPLLAGMAGRCPALPLPGARSCATPPDEPAG